MTAPDPTAPGPSAPGGTPDPTSERHDSEDAGPPRGPGSDGRPGHDSPTGGAATAYPDPAAPAEPAGHGFPTGPAAHAGPGHPAWYDRPAWYGGQPAYNSFAAPHPQRPRLPDAPVPRLLLTAAVTAGIGCAVAIPIERPGAGWPVAALVVGFAVVVAGWRTPGSVRALLAGPARAETLAWAGAAVALSAVAAVRAADWLVALCLLTACLAGMLAVAGRLMYGLARAAVSVPLAALLAMPWLGRAARRSWRRDSAGGDLRLAASVLVSVGLVVVFGALLASADAVFADVVGNVVPTLDGDTVATWIFLFALGAAAVAGAGHLLAAPPALAVPQLRPTRLRRMDWAVPVGLLVALFTLFVGVQFAAMFGNDEYVQRTTGLTFAEYARSGFWQLLVVSVLALAVIMAGVRWAPAITSADRLTKRVLLSAMALLCLVIVASALRRMWLYQQAYGFTVLRLLVGACELWLGLAFVLALVAVLRLRPWGTVRPMVGTAVAALLALAVLDPERFIAEQNVARFTATGSLDTEYLSWLSADAVPALTGLPDSAERTCILATIAASNRAGSDEDWRHANLSRSRAEAEIGGLAARAPAPDAGYDRSLDEPGAGRDGEPSCLPG